MDPFDSSKAMFGTGYGIWACDNLSLPTPTWYFRDQNLEETVSPQIISPPFTNLLSVMGDAGGFRHDNLDVSPPNRFLPNRWSTGSIAFAGKVPSKIVKACNASPYGDYSTDGGITWTAFSTCPSGITSGGSWSIAVSADGNTIVWGPTGASMSYSTNNGKNWTACSGGVPLIPPVADRVNPSLFYAYESVNGRMWISSDGGKTFSLGVTGLPTVPSWSTSDGNANPAPDNEGDIWICCGSGGLYRSASSGLDAQKINSVTEAYRIGFGKSLNAGSYPTVYLFGTVSSTLGFYRSEDEGLTWTRINDDNHQYGWIHQITGDPRVYGRCYVSAEGRGISYGQPDGSDTTDNPTTFKFLNFIPTDSLRQIYQNISINWTRATDPLGYSLTYIMHFFGPGVDTTFMSTDTAATFSAGNIQAFSTYVLTGNVTNGFNTTASSNSIFKPSASSLTTDVKESFTIIPNSFILYQNHPNPFNPSTMISFDIPTRSFVTLKVYDLLGREVTTIASEELSAGNYSRFWNASGFAGGFYFYRLQAHQISGGQAGAFTETKKLLLIK
jgi:hypothetical protein